MIINQDDVRNISRGSWERQIAKNANYNIYLKNDVTSLVMNIIQINFTGKMCIYDA